MATRNSEIYSAAQEYPTELVLERVFDAGRDLVWKVWTDPVHLAQWWGPGGFTNPRCDWNARTGGAIYIEMRGPDGTIYPMKGTFEEVEEPHRLVFVSSALDEKGAALFDVQTTVVFEDRQGKTAMKLRAQVVRSTPRAAQYLKGMEMGWAQSLERLRQHLATVASAPEAAPLQN